MKAQKVLYATLVELDNKFEKPTELVQVVQDAYKLGTHCSNMSMLES